MTSDDSRGTDLLQAHYNALKEAAANINQYRQQAVAILITAFLPGIGSLIVLATKGSEAGFARVALRYSLCTFGFFALGLAGWALSIERRQRSYRRAMVGLMRKAAADLPVGTPGKNALTSALSPDPLLRDPFENASGPWLFIGLLLLGILALGIGVFLPGIPH